MTSNRNLIGLKTALLLYLFLSPADFLRHFTKDDLADYRERVSGMFYHAYNGYLRFAYPYDELRPITCDGHDTWGSYSLTLIDALDTLAVMGNFSEFRRVANVLINSLDFDRDINVSVFETNIRVVGGLLSAHLLSRRAGMELEDGWPCSGPLLRLAEKAAIRLLPAFNTATGLPYGTVNLKYGVPKDETPITCTAGTSTFIVEFGALSRLTGNPAFEQAASRALKALWDSKSDINLVGNHIDVKTGKWTALDSGIGAGVDSYFEYLVKGSILFQYPELIEQFRAYEEAIEKYLKKEDWYMWAHMTKGTVTLPVFQSLECFWPGVQSLLGDIDKAMKTIHNYHQVWKQYGFVPEFYNIPKSDTHANREGYPLRPELIESVMYLYKATKDPFLIEVAVDILESIEKETRTRCGYATVKDVRDHRLDNRMESFFLAETTKYLYLMFDQDNFLHNTGDHGTFIETPSGSCVVDTGHYVFNTEAHPIDGAALYCCSAEKVKDDLALADLHDNIDLLSLFDLVDDKDDIFEQRGKKLMQPKSKSNILSDLEFEPELEMQIKNVQMVTLNNVQNPPKTTGTTKTIHLDVNQLKELQAGLKNPETENTILSVLQKSASAENIQNVMKDTLQKAMELIGQIGKVNEDVQQQTITLQVADAVSKQESDPNLTVDDHAGQNVESVKSEQFDSNAYSGECPANKNGAKDLTENILKDSDSLSSKDECPLDGYKNIEKYIKTGDDIIEKGDTKVSLESSKNISDSLEKVWRSDDFPARLFVCPARPFYSRLSLLGEMFTDD